MAARSEEEKDFDRAETVRPTLLTKHHENLYEVARFLDLSTRRSTGQRVPCKIYVQDPSTAAGSDGLGLQDVDLRWEPGLGDGPTSSRFAVVDYDVDRGVLGAPARWDAEDFAFFTPDGTPVGEATGSEQFRQVNAWAIAERVLEYYEDARSMGRPIPWGFEGNRLMIVPQAGFRNNAYYERHSKSLQLYYFGDRGAPRYTCLSHDIVAHEMGHAMLDGIRPHFLEHSSWETAAFHEFIGDLTAILMALRNNDVRGHLEEKFGTDLGQADVLSSIAEEFGKYVYDRKFLRTARNEMTFEQARERRESHDASQVLTGAMFDVLIAIAAQYLSEERQAKRKKPASPAQALWWAAERFGRTSLQPLDLLPPADVRFLDYARAVLRNDELTDPVDAHGYRDIIRRVFHERKLCPKPFGECDPESCVLTPPSPPRLSVFHDLREVARSRTAAYHLVDDHRRRLGIPPGQDFVIADLYACNKLGRAAERLPRQVVITYLWREAGGLEGARFGRFAGQDVELLCGGTLVFDDLSNLLWWAPKRGRGSEEGERRRAGLLDYMAQIVAERRLTLADDPEAAVLAGHTAPVVARRVGGALRLETAPHLCGAGGEEEEGWTTGF